MFVLFQIPARIPSTGCQAHQVHIGSWRLGAQVQFLISIDTLLVGTNTTMVCCQTGWCQAKIGNYKYGPKRTYQQFQFRASASP